MRNQTIRLLALPACFAFIFSAYAQLQIDSFPANIYPSANAPFIHGVTSGDPLPNAVVIWTRVDTADESATVSGQWFVASDTLFTNVVASGTYTTDSSTDFTVNIDATGLSPATIYYYRFSDGQGHYSERGRTKTAPVGHISQLTMGVMSCSSIFSGFFNAYRHLGNREVFDALIHLGDYIYDFVDENEKVRIPSPYPQEPENTAEWRARHRYYLLDPDLRLARKNHPWIALWDNHDRAGDEVDPVGDKVFREYLPIRLTSRVQNDSIFRRFTFGDLADVWITDVGSYRSGDTFPNGEHSMMGLSQLNELIEGLKTSAAKWKIMGSQKMTGGWYTNGIPSSLLNLVPNNGPVFDSSSWDGYSGTRQRIFDTLRINHINNFIALSGDAHVSMAMDLVNDPHSQQYDKATGTGSVGVEFLPSSISRGNMDEGGLPVYLAPTIVDLEMGANPQHVYFEGTKHGYGLLEINPDSTRATFCYLPILEISNSTELKTLVVKNGENHWARASTTSAMADPADFVAVTRPYPNPTRESICLDFADTPPSSVQLKIYALGTGQLVRSESNLQQHIKTSVVGWAKGAYTIVLSHNGFSKGYKFVVE